MPDGNESTPEGGGRSARKNILVAEDDYRTRLLLVDTLSRAGYLVRPAEDAMRFSITWSTKT